MINKGGGFPYCGKPPPFAASIEGGDNAAAC